jgi:MFS family permease
MPKMGRKNSLVVGMVLLVLSSFGLGIISLIKKDWPMLFLGISIGTRFVQGIGDSLSMTTSYSIVANIYKENKVDAIGYLEAAAGLGLMVGPPLGSIIYGQLGYAWAFYFFTILLAYNLVCLVILMPNSLNKEDDEVGPSSQTQVQILPEDQE